MPDTVSDSSTFQCPFCTSKLKLQVPSSAITGDGKNIGNSSNTLFPPPGGQCTVVPSAPVPCTPSVSNIAPGQSPIAAGGPPALGSSCSYMCAKGGLITLDSSAQSSAKHDEASGGNWMDKAVNVVTEPVEGIVDEYVEAAPTSSDTASTSATPVKGAGRGASKSAAKKQVMKNELIRDEKGQLRPNIRRKPVHLPSAKKVNVNMEHVSSGHKEGGGRILQSQKNAKQYNTQSRKTLFPKDMNDKQIEQSIKQAYKRADKGKVQVSVEKSTGVVKESVKIRGVSDEGLKIEMWLDKKTNIIDTAYPVD